MAGMEAHYDLEDGKFIVPIRLHKVRELVSPLDPSPFRERDLAEQVEDYLVDAALDIPASTPMKIVVYLATPPTDADRQTGDLSASIHHYFGYQEDRATRELRAVFREARVSLAIGLTFLSVCLGLREIAAVGLEGPLADIVREGLLISGWVALWRPIQLLLYEWWPVRRRRRLYRRLEEVEIELRIEEAP